MVCALRPGVPGLSENISVISIVDRFLEHPRVMIFEGGGDKKVYISSADWMTRNLEKRIEVGCPIYSERLREQITNMIELHFNDTLKARVIDAEQTNAYVKRGNRRLLQSQIETYKYLQALEELPYYQENTDTAD